MSVLVVRDYNWEATASHEELVSAYGDRCPAMRRRFRVERSVAGNGRLALRSQAERDAARCGGVVVEVIPLRHLGERQAADMPECTFCKAGVKTLKVTEGGAAVCGYCVDDLKPGRRAELAR